MNNDYNCKVYANNDTGIIGKINDTDSDTLNKKKCNDDSNCIATKTDKNEWLCQKFDKEFYK